MLWLCSLAPRVVLSIVLCVSMFSNDNGTEGLEGWGFYNSKPGSALAVGGPQRWKLTLGFWRSAGLAKHKKQMLFHAEGEKN